MNRPNVDRFIHPQNGSHEHRPAGRDDSVAYRAYSSQQHASWATRLLQGTKSQVTAFRTLIGSLLVERYRKLAAAGTVLLTVLMIALLVGSPSPKSNTPPSGQQRGMALLAWDHNGYANPQLVDASLRQLASTGTGWVQIVPTWYQADQSTHEIHQSDQTVSDNDIRQVISLAHQQGLRVLLKPHVDVVDGVSRADIRPDDPNAWFASYTAFIDHYAQLATQLDVQEFAVGTELAGLSGDRAHWLGVIKTVRDRYAGPLVYAATHTEYTKVAFWDAVDLIGIDAYWPLATQPTSDAAVLERAWQPIRTKLATFAAKTKRRIVFTEAGYTSQRGTTTAPDSWTLSREPDQVEQAAAYQALLASFDNQDWWAGVFWWVPKESSETQGLGYAIYGKAAEAVLRKWW
jgi:hypothetical protein